MMPITKIKFILAIILSFIFFIFDFYVETGVVVFHVGPMIISILFVNVVTDLNKIKYGDTQLNSKNYGDTQLNS